MLFSERSVWTMLHGIALGGGALLALAAALFAMYLLRHAAAGSAARLDESARSVATLTGVAAMLTWLATLAGTYVVFPPYRATPPEGLADLAAYPRSLILADPASAWAHTFAMETKEHLPWIAAMLATSVAFAAYRYREELFTRASIRRIASLLLGVSFAIVAYISLLGVFVNKVAPLE